MNDSNLLSRWRSWAPYLLSVLRIIAAFLFMQVGTAKLFAFPAAVMPGGGTAPLATLPGIAGAL
jgi:putative oxidoreductase